MVYYCAVGCKMFLERLIFAFETTNQTIVNTFFQCTVFPFLVHIVRSQLYLPNNKLHVRNGARVIIFTSFAVQQILTPQ